MPRQFTLVLSLSICVAALIAACGGDDAPSIPHKITSQADTYCRSCHQSGANGAPVSPHPGRSDCVGCHSPTDYEPATDAGTDAQTDASGDSSTPPTIPHAVTSTDDSSCLGCHKDGTAGAPVTPHPDRTGCVNCHHTAQ